ncbi:hypothetical protein C4K88_00090 [Arthrobacter pityocampae]|uniref:Uncharacterized protein n=1 Tax=Arthrobacter pityocampae TaxID=547334 RepID=A0A2S5J0K3_9MICC|nr:hypothetical protein [Arthrobacter pityocampae]PPB50362.1 hypothetical protein C4K88_00090 [Arthrobacter pityocampae]
MTHRPNKLDRVAERIMDLDSPAYGDERERAVFMEASTFGLTTALYAGLVSAFLASVFGFLLLPVVLLVVTLLPSGAAVWYARRRNVNVQMLAETAGARSTMVSTVVFGAMMTLTFAAMAYTIFAGQPLLTISRIEVTPGEGFFGGMAQGAVVGGMIGGLAAIIGSLLSFRRANRLREARDR